MPPPYLVRRDPDLAVTSVVFHLPTTPSRLLFTFADAELALIGDRIREWAESVDEQIRLGRRIVTPRVSFAEWMRDPAVAPSAVAPLPEMETNEAFRDRIAEFARQNRPRAEADSSGMLPWQRVVITGTEEAESPPNEGAAPLVEPTHYLGLPVQRTRNVALNTVTLQSNAAGRLAIYIHPSTPTDIWQPAARARYARHLQRSAPVSIKATCRLCGKAYPARQTLAVTENYCSDRCRAQARDFIDCPACNGTGLGRNEGDKCGECFGTTYQPCAACSEDHARISLTFQNPSSGTVYNICSACVHDEREAGAVQAPQVSM